MRKSQASSASSLQPPLPQPVYRYITKPPRTLRLSVVELLTYVPAEWIREGDWNHTVTVELPCAEILQSYIPRISVEQLRSLIPQILSIPEGVAPITKVLLPTARVALSYCLSIERENVIPTSHDQSPGSETVLQKASAPHPASFPRFLGKAFWKFTTIRNIGESTLAERHCTEKFPRLTFRWFQRNKSKNCSQESQTEHTKDPSQQVQKVMEATEKEPPKEDPLSVSKNKPTPDFFASLPTFIPNPIPAVLHPEPELPVSPAPNTSSSPSATTESPPAIQCPPEDQEIRPLFRKLIQTPDPPPPVIKPEEKSDPAVLGKQHLITPFSQTSERLSNEHQLQALLLTEEPLSIHHVVDLCCQLPGIRTCLLVRGEEVIATSHLPGNLDPMPLSSQTRLLLESVRRTSIQMGLGMVKALTLFASCGPVSCLQDQDLCFLVLHEDQERGFIPGVREKMQAVLEELHKSRLFVPTDVLASKAVTKLIQSEAPTQFEL